VNQAGKSSLAISPKEVPGKFSYKAGMMKDGTIRLFVDNKEIARAKTAGLFKKELELPLRVGLDNRKGTERLDNYPDSVFALRTGINNNKLETLDAPKSATAEVTGKIDKTIVLKVVKDVMKYDKQLISAKAALPYRLF
jgi:hypothetical protein